LETIMAIHAPITGAPTRATPLLPSLAAILAQFDRQAIESTVETLIELMDRDDGEPDAEDDDPDSENEARREGADPSWSEWHTRGNRRVGEHGSEPVRGRCGNVLHEDAEDDDPAEDDGEDACGALDDDLSDWGPMHAGQSCSRKRTLAGDFCMDNEDSEESDHGGDEHDGREQEEGIPACYAIDQARGPLPIELEAVTIGNDA
jgi:hypothetical protein